MTAGQRYPLIFRPVLPEPLDFILADLQELKRILFNPQSNQVIMAVVEAA